MLAALTYIPELSPVDQFLTCRDGSLTGLSRALGSFGPRDGE